MSAGLPRAARPLRRKNSLDVIAETALNGIVLRVTGELRSEALSEIRERISEAKRSSTRLSVDLPMIVEIVDKPDRIATVLPEIDSMLGEGLVTRERVQVILYRHEKRSRPSKAARKPPE